MAWATMSGTQNISLELIGSFDRNTADYSMYQFTEDETILRSSLYYPNKRPWEQLWKQVHEYPHWLFEQASIL